MLTDIAGSGKKAGLLATPQFFRTALPPTKVKGKSQGEGKGFHAP